jgi:hypothetical protein
MVQESESSQMEKSGRPILMEHLKIPTDNDLMEETIA